MLLWVISLSLYLGKENKERPIHVPITLKKEKGFIEPPYFQRLFSGAGPQYFTVFATGGVFPFDFDIKFKQES